MAKKCPYGDPCCPCQDGDPCHYEDAPDGTKGMTPPDEKPVIEHKEFDKKLYSRWKTMVHRCHNKKHMKFRSYGGKGIIVCEEWRNYSNFKKWGLENGYDPSLQIDRIDSDGNYEPSNCRFVTTRENLLNRKNTKLVTAFGETKAMSQWAEDTRCLVKDQTFRERIRSNWIPEIALTKKADFGNRCRI